MQEQNPYTPPIKIDRLLALYLGVYDLSIKRYIIEDVVVGRHFCRRHI
jgi:hypothetical protein